jgi:tetratricopeptide (TPR) repeat protein
LQIEMGDHVSAVENLISGILIGHSLIAEYPDDLQLRYDLALSHFKAGNANVVAGDLAAATTQYTESAILRERLVSQNPENLQWQRDLSFSYDKVAEVLISGNETQNALKNYKMAFSIAERLAKHDPSNVTWQRDLMISHMNLADLDENPVENLSAALFIVKVMSVAGVLEETDQWLITDLQERIDQLKPKPFGALTKALLRIVQR